MYGDAVSVGSARLDQGIQRGETPRPLGGPQAALNGFDGEIDRTGKAIDNLVERLQPVISQLPVTEKESGKDNVAPSSGVSTLSERIDGCRYRLARLNNLIEALTKRIDL